MSSIVMNGATYLCLVKSGANKLKQNKQIVNDLNVFPIPDGDTGDNMYMTINSGATALADAEGMSLSDVSNKVARGMLLGARGNSGVILSRIYAGIAKGFEGLEEADIKQVASAFEVGIQESYKAVSVPTEGTILTVFREAVTYANSKVTDSSDLITYFKDMNTELLASLERTPELLAVLKEAGVVDSGGAGFAYIAQGMQTAAAGSPVEEDGEAQPITKAPVDLSAFNEDSVLEFGYCTEFLLQLQRSKVDLDAFDVNIIIDYLNSVGESVVCFRDGNIVKAHVHTMKPGDILNHMQAYGEYLTLKIENMTLQHNETTIQNTFSFKKKVRKKYGTVTVCSGKGIKETFEAIGVDYVVEGGQSMNPSAEAFLKAFDEANSDVIFVFPNNGNVILAAKQAAELYEDSKVYIVPTKTVGEGYAALSMLDTTSDDPDAIVEELTEIAKNVVTGSVSVASRNTEMDGVEVIAGEYIGFTEEAIYVNEKTPDEALIALADKIDTGSYDVALLVFGEKADPSKNDDLISLFIEKYPNTEIIPIQGDQPVYDYILILE